MENPLVSIIMNCHNGERFLREAIDSVYAQTYSNWEIIFWDNVSTDDSSSIAQSYDNRLRYYLSEGFTSLGMARELAVQKSNGEYVAFLDCDDFWHHSKLSMQIPLFFRHEDVGVVYSNYWIVNSERKKIFSKKKLPIGDILDDLLGSDSVGFLTAIIKRRVFRKFLPFFNTRYNIIHDFDLMIRISIEWKFSCVQFPLASYRYHGENETIVKSLQYTRELEEWIDKNKSNSKISNQRNFYRRQVVLMYLRGIESIQNKEVKRAICFLYKMPLCWEKMKLLVFILLPNSILRSIKSKP